MENNPKHYRLFGVNNQAIRNQQLEQFDKDINSRACLQNANLRNQVAVSNLWQFNGYQSKGNY